MDKVDFIPAFAVLHSEEEVNGRQDSVPTKSVWNAVIKVINLNDKHTPKLHMSPDKQ